MLNGANVALVREATEADISAICEIYNDAVLHSTATADLEPVSVDDRLRWLRDHWETGHPVLVASDQSHKVVGWASLSPYSHKPGYRQTAENSVYIHPQEMGRGYGTLLLRELLSTSRALGFHTIIARIDAKNQVSIRMHEKFGFVSVGVFREMVFKFDQWLDSIHMQIIL